MFDIDGVIFCYYNGTSASPQVRLHLFLLKEFWTITV